MKAVLQQRAFRFDFQIHLQPVVRYNNNDNSEITFEQRSFDQLQIYEKKMVSRKSDFFEYPGESFTIPLIRSAPGPRAPVLRALYRIAVAIVSRRNCDNSRLYCNCSRCAMDDTAPAPAVLGVAQRLQLQYTLELSQLRRDTIATAIL